MRSSVLSYDKVKANKRLFHGKAQVSIEYLSNYIWLLVILGIVLYILFLSSKGYPAISSCKFSSGISCSDILFSINSTLHASKFVAFLSNSKPYTIRNPKIILSVDGINKSYACTPNTIAPGGTILCTGDFGKIQNGESLVKGKLFLSATECFSLNNSNCNVPINETFAGSFTTYISSFSNSNISISLYARDNVVEANGTSDYIYAKVVAFGHPIEGATILFSASNSTFNIKPTYVVTNSSGIALGSISSTHGGTVYITATYGNYSSQKLFITFKPYLTTTTTSIPTTVSTTVFTTSIATTSIATTTLPGSTPTTTIPYSASQTKIACNNTFQGSFLDGYGQFMCNFTNRSSGSWLPLTSMPSHGIPLTLLFAASSGYTKFPNSIGNYSPYINQLLYNNYSVIGNSTYFYNYNFGLFSWLFYYIQLVQNIGKYQNIGFVAYMNYSSNETTYKENFIYQSNSTFNFNYTYSSLPNSFDTCIVNASSGAPLGTFIIAMACGPDAICYPLKLPQGCFTLIEQPYIAQNFTYNIDSYETGQGSVFLGICPFQNPGKYTLPIDVNFTNTYSKYQTKAYGSIAVYEYGECVPSSIFQSH
ncbi:MAG: Ig-like domain-containing protein [Candidatus Micrarchaeia archaeon]